MGLWNVSVTEPLSKTEWKLPAEMGGWSASWSVPFAGRVYVEKLVCSVSVPNLTHLKNELEKVDESNDGATDANTKEMVRILVNDRVIPLQNCGGGAEYAGLGMCEVDKWIESLEFVRSGGRWDDCYAK